MKKILARTRSEVYEIVLSTDALKSVGDITAHQITGNKAFIVTDRNVADRYLDTVVSSLREADLTVSSHVLEPGEDRKNHEELYKLYGRFHDFKLTRSDAVIALGGGVIGDLTGMAAATYLRGIPLIAVPTTLLAQVDSSIGGKTAINMPFGKNMVGCFYQPSAVITDPKTLSTLPRSVMNDGVAEVVKYGCIKDPDLFDHVASGQMDLEWVLERCILIKTAIVENDELDHGERMLLNFGHTVGHAIEKCGGYRDWTHGQGVSAGMVLAAVLGEKLSITDPGTSKHIRDCLLKHDLPVHIPYGADEMLQAMLSDKKTRSESIHFIFLKNIGDSVIKRMPVKELEHHLREVLRS